MCPLPLLLGRFTFRGLSSSTFPLYCYILFSPGQLKFCNNRRLYRGFRCAYLFRQLCPGFLSILIIYVCGIFISGNPAREVFLSELCGYSAITAIYSLIYIVCIILLIPLNHSFFFYKYIYR